MRKKNIDNVSACKKNYGECVRVKKFKRSLTCNIGCGRVSYVLDNWVNLTKLERFCSSVLRLEKVTWSNS